MTGEFIPPTFAWDSLLEAAFRQSLGLPPDTRTEEQRAADLERHRQRCAEAQTRILAEHAQTLAAAHGLRRAVLELHAPTIRGEWSDKADCSGCEYGGWESEPPEFPCTTYELARDFAGGDR